VALFLSDKDDGATNAKLTPLLKPAAYWAVNEKSSLRLNGQPGGFAALMQHDGVFKADISQGEPRPFDFTATATSAATERPVRLDFACHCGSVRFDAPIEALDLCHCACISCNKASGGLIWSALTYCAEDVRFKSGDLCAFSFKTLSMPFTIL
jgi:hypothetical protein